MLIVNSSGRPVRNQWWVKNIYTEINQNYVEFKVETIPLNKLFIKLYFFILKYILDKIRRKEWKQ